MTPQMEAALAGEKAIVTVLIRVQLPGHTIFWLCGAGVLPWGEDTYGGIDPTFGVIADVEEIEEGEEDQAPSFSFGVHPPGNAAAALLCAAGNQGSPIDVWLAAVNPITGHAVPDPDLLFSGTIDQPVLSPEPGQLRVDIECVSDFDKLLEDDEGARLSDAHHQSIFPGETGFANVTGSEEVAYWGTSAPQGGATARPSGGIGEIAANYSWS